MIKELYTTTIRETSINVSMSQIDSIRRKDITRSGCRVYHDGYIGISGTLGEAGNQTWAEAEANLDLKIPYPFEPEKDFVRHIDLRGAEISERVFIRLVEVLLSTLRENYPQFIFSNKISLTETETTLSNDAGLDLVSLDRTVEFSLLVKHKESASIFDTFLLRQSRDFEMDAVLNDAREMLGSFTTETTLPAAGKIPVVILPEELFGKLNDSLNGESIARGASLFCGKIGQTVFNPAFTLLQDRSAEKKHMPFFDMEGVTQSEDVCPLIENGVILRAFTDKKNAALLGEKTTGAASSAYDEAPALAGAPLTIAPSEQTLKELLGGQPAMLVAIASGGDYTSQGDFAAPVQLGLLTDGEHLLGRLPECNIRGNLYDLFGADFIGVSSDRPLFGERLLVVRMECSCGE